MVSWNTVRNEKARKSGRGVRVPVSFAAEATTRNQISGRCARRANPKRRDGQLVARLLADQMEGHADGDERGAALMIQSMGMIDMLQWGTNVASAVHAAMKNVRPWPPQSIALGVAAAYEEDGRCDYRRRRDEDRAEDRRPRRRPERRRRGRDRRRAGRRRRRRRGRPAPMWADVGANAQSSSPFMQAIAHWSKLAQENPVRRSKRRRSRGPRHAAPTDVIIINGKPSAVWAAWCAFSPSLHGGAWYCLRQDRALSRSNETWEDRDASVLQPMRTMADATTGAGDDDEAVLTKSHAQGPWARRRGCKEHSPGVVIRSSRVKLRAQRVNVAVGQPEGSTGRLARASLCQALRCAELKFENPVERSLPSTSLSAATAHTPGTRNREALGHLAGQASREMLCTTLLVRRAPARHANGPQRRRRVQSTHPIRAAVSSDF